MKTETMLMVLVAFLIGWFSRTMMSGLVEGIQAPSPPIPRWFPPPTHKKPKGETFGDGPAVTYDTDVETFLGATEDIKSCARTMVKLQPDMFKPFKFKGNKYSALDAATQECADDQE
jgi:hypothetical protein